MLDSKTMARLDMLKERWESKGWESVPDENTVLHIRRTLDELIELLRGDNGQ